MSDELKQLHNEVAKELLLRIQTGDAKPADLAVAVKFLKDNEITALPVNDNPLQQLMTNMPFPTQMELDEARRGN
tara:strand:+ start:802 stop:1026 length:225 start_codon:yes stop_codon:yes gene_type:complete